jgi:uncharacterized membrane protein YedE/YeeE
MRDPERLWNPYAGGVVLGLVLLAAFVVMGQGLGAASASWRLGVAALDVVAPAHVARTETLAIAKARGNPLDDWVVVEVVGVALGALVAAWTSGRLRREVLRGPTFGAGSRLALAIAGGVLMGAAARMARGCTSGQALSGGALLSAGAWAFMLAVFAGGYATAWFVRRQWR